MKYVLGFILIVQALIVGCAQPPSPELLFWHHHTMKNADTLLEIVRAYNATNPAMKVKAEYAGTYDEIYRKTMASIMANKLPDLAEAYPSMVTEYMAAGVAAPADEFIADSQNGLSEQEMTDFFEPVLEDNRFPQHGNRLVSFPFLKSVLMLYYNQDLLYQSGIVHPPVTWDEFLGQCRQVTEKTEARGFSFREDASDVCAIAFSLGEQLAETPDLPQRLQGPEMQKALGLFRDLLASGAAYQVRPKSMEHRADFSNGKAAFIMQSSTAFPYVMDEVKDRFRWDLSAIPRGRPDDAPRTNLFGANIVIFKSTPEREQAAWQFVKYFTSPEVTALWASRTGYLPLRKSAAQTDTLINFFQSDLRNRKPFDQLPHGISEPNLAGWQEVRDAIETAQTSVMLGMKTPQEAAEKIAETAAAVLKYR